MRFFFSIFRSCFPILSIFCNFGVPNRRHKIEKSKNRWELLGKLDEAGYHGEGGKRIKQSRGSSRNSASAGYNALIAGGRRLSEEERAHGAMSPKNQREKIFGVGEAKTYFKSFVCRFFIFFLTTTTPCFYKNRNG